MNNNLIESTRVLYYITALIRNTITNARTFLSRSSAFAAKSSQNVRREIQLKITQPCSIIAANCCLQAQTLASCQSLSPFCNQLAHACLHPKRYHIMTGPTQNKRLTPFSYALFISPSKPTTLINSNSRIVWVNASFAMALGSFRPHCQPMFCRLIKALGSDQDRIELINFC